MSRYFSGLTLVLFLAAGSVAAPLSLGPRHRDEGEGFQIQIPRKWEQIPTKFQEVAVVGKWTGKAKRGRYIPELNVLRFRRAQPAEGATPREAAEKGVPGFSGMLRFQPKDTWEYIQRNIGPRMEVVEDDPEFKMSRTKSFKGHLRVYAQKGARDDRRAMTAQLTIVAAQIETLEPSDTFYGVIYFCADSDAKDMVRTFKNSIKRFRVLTPDEEDEEEEGGVTDADIFVDSEKKPEIWREARRKKLIKGWKAIDTKNYLIVYNKDVKKRTIKTIAKHIEAIRLDVYEKLFPPTREVKAVSVVRVCKDMAEYHRYGGPGGSAGYWSPGDEELVIPGGHTDSLRILYHEAFHQYIHYAVGKVAPHSWFNEGHGDYFSGHNYRAKKFKAAPFRWRTGIIANAISQKTYVPLEKFLKYTQGEYYSNAGLCYAQGWSFIYFLREVERRKIRKYKKYYGLLDRYFEAIKRNVKTVQEGGLEGLNEPPVEEPDGCGEGCGHEEDVEAGAPPEPTGLPRLPGLEKPFPGEHPEAGAGEPSNGGGATDTGPGGKTNERRTVAGPQIKDTRSALDTAVDEVFLKNRNIDIAQLEKDWLAFMKKN